MVRDVLYFGRNTPGGAELSDSVYKRRFAQEAVLRERVTTCSRF